MEKLKKIEKIFKGLGDKNRLRILNLLLKKPFCVCELTSVLNLSQSTVSGHLKVLKDADIVEDIKSGLFVEYHPNRESTLLEAIYPLIKREFLTDEIAETDRQKSDIADRYELCKK